ncbi:MAG: hypothetical protein HKN91_01915 [Acidimicrobiia bacterium]|nr:hypothetical protein [Acidimicrobiia bacterium]
MRSQPLPQVARALRIQIVAMLAALAVLVPASQTAAQAAITDDVDLTVVASGLSLAVDLTAPPGDDRLFVVEKVGRIRIIKNGTVLSTPFLDITGPVRSSANEQGLLGLAFPDDYAETGLFYVHYTSDAGSGDTAIAEYKVSANPDVADASSGRILFTRDQPNSNHNGGGIHIGPDGYLYASLGDGGGGGDPGEHGQNINTTLGSIIRLDPATGEAAPGNPFIDAAGADAIWVYGLRNPWRFSFDRATGDIFIGDVGQGALEEIDVAPAGVGGLNFGWDAYEGTRCFEGPCNEAGKVFPVVEYGHRSGGACGGSVTGGYVYRGNELPWLRGHYFYADWCHGDLKSFRLHNGKAKQKTNWSNILGAPGFITAFGEDGFGELYMLAQGNVYKFTSERNPECDFNGDGRADVPVGVSGESHSGAANAGRVMVFWGVAGPIDPAQNTNFRQGGNGLPGVPGADERFGASLACGNFNGDSYWDLAIGVPGEGGGAVQVLYGDANGLSTSGADTWTQVTLGVGAEAAGDTFGFALGAGDINRDGFDDLAVGAPGDNEAGENGSGSVTAVFGSATGLNAAGAVLLHQSSQGIVNDAGQDDNMGYSVAVGDIDGDGFADVASGVPGESVAGYPGAGAVSVIFGNSAGLGPRDVLMHRNRPGIRSTAAEAAHFGRAVEIGRFDLDGFDDLAVGVARADDSGAVHVIHGGPNGLSKRDHVFGQGAGSIPDTREAGDGFGFALAAGDSNGDGFDELAIGAPGEDHSGVERAGLVGVMPGSIAGLDPSGYTTWHQEVAGILGVAQADDQFGAAVRFLDTRGDTRLELIVGSTQTVRGGEVNWFRGLKAGLTVVGDRRWMQNTPGVIGDSEANDFFGGAL